MNKYLFDTHIHTSETSPCSNLDAETLVKLYKKAGYSGFVITDHYAESSIAPIREENWQNTMDSFLKGFNRAHNLGKESNFEVFLGIELTFLENMNDYLIYGITKNFLYQNRELHKLTLESFRILAEKNNLLIFQAHPFRKVCTPADPNLLDGVEIYNGNPRHNSNNKFAAEYAEKHNLLKLSGSDAHQVSDIGLGGLKLINNPKSYSEFMEILKKPKEELIFS